MLLRNPFTKALFDARRSLLGWVIAIVGAGTMYASFWPTMRTPEMKQALDSYPQGVLEAFNYSDLSSAAGYLGSSVYGLVVPLLVVAFAIAAGTRAVAGDEDAGTLDLLLAHPVGRSRLALERVGALAVTVLGITALLGLTMVALSGPAKFDGIGAAGFGAMTVHLALFGITFGTLAFAVGAATGSRGMALGLSAGVAVLAYLANSVLPQVESLTWAQNLSPFHWYLGNSPLVNGLQPGGTALLLGAAVVLTAAGTWAFNRRDVAV